MSPKIRSATSAKPKCSDSQSTEDPSRTSRNSRERILQTKLAANYILEIMQMQVFSQLHRSNIAIPLPSSRPFSQNNRRAATSQEISRPCTFARYQRTWHAQASKRVDAEIVQEEESTSHLDVLQTEDAQISQTSAPWRLFRKLCQAVTVGALCLAMVSSLCFCWPA